MEIDPLPDDDSQATPPANGNLNPNDSQTMEKTIKFRFAPATNRNDQVAPALIHMHILSSIQEAYGDEIDILDNNNKILPKIDPIRCTTLQHSRHFVTHNYNPSNNTPTDNQHRVKSSSAFIIHRIRTNAKLGDIKRTQRVRRLLEEHSCFLDIHRWSETVWNTAQIGFMLGYDPKFYDDTQATHKFMNDLKSKLPSNVRIPKFRLANCSPQLRTQTRRYVTSAYVIETEKSNSMEMLNVLKQAYKETSEFVPFKMKSKHPATFVKYIMQQSTVRNANKTIVINSIGPDAMYYLSHHITAVDGVLDLLPARTVERDGNYRVLVRETEYLQVKAELAKSIPQWYEEHVAPDARPMREDRYPYPPGVAGVSRDGYSSGEDSYMSHSVNTALSYDTITDDEHRFMQQPQMHQENRRFNTSLAPDDFMTWADHARRAPNLPHPSMITAPDQSGDNRPSIEEEVLSDLASSRAEVEELRKEVIRMAERQEEQRNELIRAHEAQKVEMMQMFREQMEKALSSQASTTIAPQLEAHLTNQMSLLFQKQDERFQAMSDMFSNALLSLPAHNHMKRSQSSLHDENDLHDSPRNDKRHDIKTTPTKLQPKRGIPRGIPPPNDDGHEEMDCQGDSSDIASNTQQFSTASGGEDESL